jgi:hypothetical protein
VSDVVDTLQAEVQAARDANAAYRQHTERIKALLVQARRERPDLGLAGLEELIGRFYDRATISRITAPEFDGKPPRKRTRRPAGT